MISVSLVPRRKTMSYRSRYAEACRELFADFEPDLAGCRQPDVVREVARLAAQGLYSHEIAARVGKTPKAVQKIYRRYNFPTLHNHCPPLREERRGWKGGVKVVRGYSYARTPGHPHASKHGSYVAVHRLVMEQTLGRYLLPSEVVDHIDGNTQNNDPSNLRVFASNGEHLAATLKGRCPKWSEEGKRRISEAVRERHRRAREQKAAASRQASGTDAQQ